MPTSTAIPISEASTQLGLTEEEFRKMLKGIYKNPTTVKKISLENFKVIAETLQQRASEEAEPQIEDTTDTPIEDNTDTPQLETQTEDTPQLETQTEDAPQLDTQTELQDSTIEDTPIEEETKNVDEFTSLATTDSQALDIPQDRAKIQLNINLNLSNQILDLNKISSALAIVAGEAAVKNFEEIYTHTFNSGVDRILENFAHKTYSTIQQLREVDNSDFLTQKGRDTSKVDTQTAISLVSQFL